MFSPISDGWGHIAQAIVRVRQIQRLVQGGSVEQASCQDFNMKNTEETLALWSLHVQILTVLSNLLVNANQREINVRFSSLYKYKHCIENISDTRNVLIEQVSGKRISP